LTGAGKYSPSGNYSRLTLSLKVRSALRTFHFLQTWDRVKRRLFELGIASIESYFHLKCTLVGCCIFASPLFATTIVYLLIADKLDSRSWKLSLASMLLQIGYTSQPQKGRTTLLIIGNPDTVHHDCRLHIVYS
jgi:hypothetical protein